MGCEQDDGELGHLTGLDGGHGHPLDLDPAGTAVYRLAQARDQHQHQKHQGQGVKGIGPLAQPVVIQIAHHPHDPQAQQGVEELGADILIAVPVIVIAGGIAGTEQHDEPEHQQDQQVGQERRLHPARVLVEETGSAAQGPGRPIGTGPACLPGPAGRPPDGAAGSRRAPGPALAGSSRLGPALTWLPAGLGPSVHPGLGAAGLLRHGISPGGIALAAVPVLPSGDGVMPLPAPVLAAAGPVVVGRRHAPSPPFAFKILFYSFVLSSAGQRAAPAGQRPGPRR